jgi:pimeloyl-ACP methyl ester carboxylesterase
MVEDKGQRPEGKGTEGNGANSSDPVRTSGLSPLTSNLPVVILPGIQGHWEWMRPAVDALRRTREVRTFSLNAESGQGDPFAQWVDLIDKAIDDMGVTKAAIMGVSFGGVVAMHYAAVRPERTAALVLVSAPSPRMRLAPAEAMLVKRPLTLLPGFPLFAVRALQRLLPEVMTAIDSWPARLRFLTTYGWQVARRPMRPFQSARWVREWQSRDLAAECAQVQAPTRIITGDAALDKVVRTTSTHDYLSLIAGSTAATLDRTGHIGLVTRPAAFAALVEEFLNGFDSSRSRRSA